MPTSAKGLTFHATASKAGRKYVGAKGGQIATTPVTYHNQAIEDKRQAELAARKARRGGK